MRPCEHEIFVTTGLGGSGVVNLYITNLGFGEPMVQYDRGELRWLMALSGLLLGKVDFFLPNLSGHSGNTVAKERVGRQTVFAWPFPEAATVAKDLKIRGNSYAAMGTAPDVWNAMLGILVNSFRDHSGGTRNSRSSWPIFLNPWYWRQMLSCKKLAQERRMP